MQIARTININLVLCSVDKFLALNCWVILVFDNLFALIFSATAKVPHALNYASATRSQLVKFGGGTSSRTQKKKKTQLGLEVN